MVSQELITKIRQLEIRTRRLLNGALVGDSRSAVKGSGFEFDQIRDYQFGDDIRFIDWTSSSRMQKMLVKQYFEERNRTIILALDTSSSGLFSSTHDVRSDIMGQIASVLALVADYGKDSVGLLLFSDEIEFFLPPGKGRAHVHKIMERALSAPIGKKRTSIQAALDYLAPLPWSNAMVFLISDFIDQNFKKAEQSMAYAARKFDLVAIRCLDDREAELPAVGLVTMEDSETGQMVTVDLRKRSVGKVQQFLKQRVDNQQALFKRYSIDQIDVKLNKPFIEDLVRFFRRRMMY